MLFIVLPQVTWAVFSCLVFTRTQHNYTMLIASTQAPLVPLSGSTVLLVYPLTYVLFNFPPFCHTFSAVDTTAHVPLSFVRALETSLYYQKLNIQHTITSSLAQKYIQKLYISLRLCSTHTLSSSERGM